MGAFSVMARRIFGVKLAEFVARRGDSDQLRLTGMGIDRSPM
jgi:hypothetical protein